MQLYVIFAQRQLCAVFLHVAAYRRHIDRMLFRPLVFLATYSSVI